MISNFRAAAEPASNRVNRGGSWNNDARRCRAANRNNWNVRNRNDNIGFRLASAKQNYNARQTALTGSVSAHKVLTRLLSSARKSGTKSQLPFRLVDSQSKTGMGANQGMQKTASIARVTQIIE